VPTRQGSGRGGSTAATVSAVNGELFDENVVRAAIPHESEETWIIQNSSGGWRHPTHMRFEEHRPLRRDGKPIPQIPRANPQINGAIDYSRRDVIPLNENNEVQVFMRFRDMKGRYVTHCYNVVHEDHAMMIRFDITWCIRGLSGPAAGAARSKLASRLTKDASGSPPVSIAIAFGQPIVIGRLWRLAAQRWWREHKSMKQAVQCNGTVLLQCRRVW
jgi:Multicopper oxidase